MKNRYIFYLILLSSCIAHVENKEDAYFYANQFCNCVELKLQTDSLVDLDSCHNSAVIESRFFSIYRGEFSIYRGEDKSKFSQATIDSADNFVIDYRNIIDSQCGLVIPRNRVKQKPHFGM